MGALVEGTFRIRNVVESQDVKRTLAALQALGVSIRKEAGGLQVEGRAKKGLQGPAEPLEMGNSGTTTRLLMGLLAGHPFPATFQGDASLSKRPMRRVVEPLEKMGASIRSPQGQKDHLPLTIRGGNLKGIRYTPPVPSAQVKSALLLAGLHAEGPTIVEEPIPTRDHTERMLAYLGADLVVEASRVKLEPGGSLRAKDFDIPGDFSSAAFFLVAAAIVPNSNVTAEGVGLNPTRTKLLDLLERMGARVETVKEPDDAWGEPRGNVTVRHAKLRAVHVPASQVPQLIDELPVFLVAATQAEGQTRIDGVQELRVKETDRIQSMVSGLTAMGADIRVEKESLVIQGSTPLQGGKSVDSFQDHRTAMALAVAGSGASGGTTIVRESEWIDISFPNFEACLAAIRH